MKRTITTGGGLTVAQALFMEGVWEGVALCSGLGRCGRCRVRFEGTAPEPGPVELRVLAAQELAQGVRLACRHQAVEGQRVSVPEWQARQGGRPVAQGRRVAVDLGTTSLEWSVLGERGERLDSGGELNPQMGSGSEVMSRLAFAADPDRAEKLRRVVLDRLAVLTDGAEALAVAGNSAMIHLLLGQDVSGLALAPYRLDYRGGEWRELDPGLPRAYIPPLLSPFVGADLSAGVAALRGMEGFEYPFLLADLGTNGEFVLGLGPEEYIVTSVPMGPALEGIGPGLGSVAGPGVAIRFELGPAGLRPVAWSGTGEADRISGTGYVSLLAQLLRCGLLRRDGTFGEPRTPLARRLASGLEAGGGERVLRISERLFLTGSDVEEILKVKAAFNLALSLLAEAGGGLRGTRIWLAGALGAHVGPADLEELGFLPSGWAGRLAVAGNTSLAGAELALASGETREWMERLPGFVRVIEPALGEGFARRYLGRMVFDYVP